MLSNIKLKINPKAITEIKCNIEDNRIYIAYSYKSYLTLSPMQEHREQAIFWEIILII